LESILGLLKSLKIRAQDGDGPPCRNEEFRMQKWGDQKQGCGEKNGWDFDLWMKGLVYRSEGTLIQEGGTRCRIEGTRCRKDLAKMYRNEGDQDAKMEDKMQKWEEWM
jgi:hypothetical protein